MATITAPRRRTFSPVGLDIGQTGGRAVQLRRVGAKWSLSAALHWPLRRSEDQDTGAAGLQERLSRALQQNAFVGREIVVGLSQPDVELHALELPGVPDGGGDLGQLDSAARWEIERLSSFEEGATETAQWWLPRGRGTRTTAVGVAVPRKTVDQMWDLCRRAGGDCRRIDALTCALSRAGSALRTPGQDEVWGILDLGARAVRLILCVDDVPVVARSLEGGGGQWTEKIAEALKVSAESAELHKCDHGVGNTNRGREVLDPQATGSAADSAGSGDRQDGPLAELAGMIFAALSTELDRIAREVERSYEYALQCYPQRKAADLILSGGSAALRNLDAYLAQRLGIPVARAEAYLAHSDSLLCGDGAALRLRESLAAYLGAVGLAIDPESGS
ncbi:MAG: hypothetical protein ACYS7M_04420 [Planctomycetota bacterium]|jgi:Tfp pilus assembly PilM family ATPase